MDVNTAFPNSVIKEEVYLEQLDGVVVHKKDSHVCKLKKDLYRLKQAPCAWYGRIDGFLVSLGFTKSDANPNLYYKIVNDEPLILVLYVDDLFLTGNEKLIVWCKKKLASEFEMKDLGLMHYFLGLEVWQRQKDIFLGQGKYTIDILKRFGMLDCKSIATLMDANLKKSRDSASDSNLIDPTMYRRLIGSLMYLTNTRPNICFVVNALSQFMCEPRKIHWIATKHVLRYLRGTMGDGLRYDLECDLKLQGFTDSDWVRCSTNSNNTSGCCFSLGFAVISW